MTGLDICFRVSYRNNKSYNMVKYHGTLFLDFFCRSSLFFIWKKNVTLRSTISISQFSLSCFFFILNFMVQDSNFPIRFLMRFQMSICRLVFCLRWNFFRVVCYTLIIQGGSGTFAKLFSPTLQIFSFLKILERLILKWDFFFSRFYPSRKKDFRYIFLEKICCIDL